jgi:hypothetical protein
VARLIFRLTFYLLLMFNCAPPARLTALLSRPGARQLGLLLGLALLATGCVGGLPRRDGAVAGPFFAPTNTRSAHSLPAEIVRVAVLPLAPDGPRLTEEQLARLDPVLHAGFARTLRAEHVPVSPALMRRLARAPRLPSTAAWPADFLARLRAETGADAVLFLDLTAYQAHPPLRVGLRARLQRLDPALGGDRALLWAADNMFDAAAAPVANSARRFVRQPDDVSRAPADRSTTVLQSPSQFLTYVAEATFVTLPPRLAGAAESE